MWERVPGLTLHADLGNIDYDQVTQGCSYVWRHAAALPKHPDCVANSGTMRFL